MPAQSKVRKPWVARMGKRYLERGVRGDHENLRPFPGRLDDQRQQVKGATGPGPAESVSQFRDAGVEWVTGYSAVAPQVAGYRISCEFQIRGPGRPGASGANTVISGRIRPPLVVSRRWVTHSAAIPAAEVMSRRSRTRKLCQ